MTRSRLALLGAFFIPPTCELANWVNWSKSQSQSQRESNIHMSQTQTWELANWLGAGALGCCGCCWGSCCWCLCCCCCCCCCWCCCCKGGGSIPGGVDWVLMYLSICNDFNYFKINISCLWEKKWEHREKTSHVSQYYHFLPCCQNIPQFCPEITESIVNIYLIFITQSFFSIQAIFTILYCASCSQSEASIQVTWSLSTYQRLVFRWCDHMISLVLTNQRLVSRSRDQSRPIRGHYLCSYEKQISVYVSKYWCSQRRKIKQTSSLNYAFFRYFSKLLYLFFLKWKWKDSFIGSPYFISNFSCVLQQI